MTLLGSIRANQSVLVSYGTLDVNSVSGVDPTGVSVCHTELQSALDNASYRRIVFDGIYRIQGQLTIPTGKHVILKSGTSIRIYNNVATSTISAFDLNTESAIELEPCSEITTETAGTINYIGIRNVSGAYGFTICGRGKIHNFGRHGISLNSTVAAPNQYVTGLIKDVRVHNISDVNGSFGDGIKIAAGTEFVRMENIEVWDCESNGVYILGANNPISSANLSKNAKYGLKVYGFASNSDHFTVNGAMFGHNTLGAIDITDVDTGLDIGGCSVYGKVSVINSKGVSFNGCGIQADAYWNIETGAAGGAVNINGGHTINGTQANFLANMTGGGTLTFDRTLEV